MKQNKIAYKQEEIKKYKSDLKNLAIMFKGRGLYDSVQRFLESKDLFVSRGSIARFYKENLPEFVKTDRLEYGTGNQVKVGRVERDSFICKTTSETYVRLAEKWVREYTSMMTEMLREENDQDLVIHHIDGNHFNNDRRNLKIMTRSEHSQLHMKKFWAERKQEVKNEEFSI